MGVGGEPYGGHPRASSHGKTSHDVLREGLQEVPRVLRPAGRVSLAEATRVVDEECHVDVAITVCIETHIERVYGIVCVIQRDLSWATTHS